MKMPNPIDIDKVANWRVANIIIGGSIMADTNTNHYLMTMPLHFVHPKDGTILTVEDCPKWYQFYLLKINNYRVSHIGDLSFQEIEKYIGPEIGTSRDGHSVDPDAVEQFCIDHKIILPEFVHLMIAGMWWRTNHH
jgi:hypothetical protein